jgi:hypothetical protein
MPKHLNRTGLQWTGNVDGPFPARILTDCEKIDQLLVAQSVQKVQALALMMGAVERVVGKLTKHRRAKLESAFVSNIAVLAGEAWRNGALAAQAEQGHRRSGSRFQSRDSEMCEEVRSRITRKKNPLTVEQASAEVSELNDADGNPRFTDRDDGETRLDEGGVKTVWYRNNPQPK